MKKIEAIIRPSKLKSVQQGLKDVEIPCMTVVPASGTGLQKSYTKIYRGTTALESTTKGSGVFYFDSPDVYCNLSVSIEDSPSTTSATTYTLYAKRASGNGTFSINRDGNNHMHVILMEIKG